MPREVGPSLNERQFFQQALKEKIRIDGRNFEDFRQVQLEFGDEYGVSDVRLGKTRVLTKISAEVTTPYPDRPFDGLFTITTALSPMTLPSFSVSGPPSETEILLSRLLEKTIRRSGALDTESLCLLAGKSCFSVRADVHILSADGNLVDAACFGVVSALRHFRRNDISVSGEEVTVYTLREREGVPLSLLHYPLCVTFSFYTPAPGEEEMVLVDATQLEEHTRDGSCTIGMNKHGEVCQIAKLGGAPTDAVMLLQCANVALQHVLKLSKIMDEKLAEDTKKRDKGGMRAELSAENARITE
ncbi:ribosomal protein S5 domain 2-like protein [Bisporella sp. PMI_857]|nr:ribosomal protein S5 domain 2-like protein [Bisporella sp. PMI_857]